MPAINYVRTKNFFIEKHTLKRPQSDMHYHHAYEIYYVLDGEREYFIGDKFFKVKSGDLVWVPKDMLHRTDGKGATRFLLYFKDKFLCEYLSESAIAKLADSEPFAFRPEDGYAQELRDLFYELLNEYNKKRTEDENYDPLIAAKYLAEVLFFIHTHDNRYAKSTTKSEDRMHLIIKYINENYPYELTVQEIADKFGVTKNHFCHMFTSSMGVTFITYLNTVRIKAACDMIKKDEDNILEISNKCGFCSPHYFYRVFKREKGMSPSGYRAQFRQKPLQKK